MVRVFLKVRGRGSLYYCIILGCKYFMSRKDFEVVCKLRKEQMETLCPIYTEKVDYLISEVWE